MLERLDRQVGRRRLGVLVAAGTAVVSGIAVFVNGYGVRAWADVTDATTYTTFKNLVAAMVLLGLGVALTRRGSAERLQRPQRRGQWIRLVVIAVIGGSVPFALFFEGLSRASSGQAAFIHKTLLVWVGIMAVVLLRERIGVAHVLAVALLIWGQAVLVGGVGEIGVGGGEVMMLAATLLWSVETIVAKRTLADLASPTVGVARMVGGAILLLAYTAWRGALADVAALQLHHVLWVLVTGAVLSVYVATWYFALARAQAIDVTAVLVGGAIITALLNVGVRGLAAPSTAGLALVGAGAAVAIAAGVRQSRRIGAA